MLQATQQTIAKPVHLAAKMATATDTEKKLIEQLTENTGKAILDSGGYYGRHWQRNQKRNFFAEPGAWYDAETDTESRRAWVNITLSTFHTLRKVLTYAPEADALFQRFDQLVCPNEPYLGVIEQFIEALNDRDIKGGVYREQDANIQNTYNWENCLDQVLQYGTFSVDNGDLYNVPDGEYLILSIHGGCDIRGGYGRGVVYECSEAYDGYVGFLSFLDRATLACPKCYFYADFSNYSMESDAVNDGEMELQGETDDYALLGNLSENDKVFCPCCLEKGKQIELIVYGYQS